MPRGAIPAAFLLSAFALSPAGRGEERQVERSFPGRSGAALSVDTYTGSIVVEPSPDSNFHITVGLDSGTEDSVVSKRLFGQVQVQIDARGAGVEVRVRNPSETKPHFEFSDHPRRVGIECRCAVPAACDLDLTTVVGGISVGNLSGRMKARTRGGMIFFRHIEGDIDADGAKGDIVISHCTGAVRLKVLLGNIRTGAIAGPVEASSTNGDIEIQHAESGASLKLTAGDAIIGVPAGIKGPVRVESDLGGIVARIDPQTRCSIQARATLGRVRLGALLPVVIRSGGDGKRSLVGQLNGGGPLVALHASSGQIRLEAPGRAGEQ